MVKRSRHHISGLSTLTDNRTCRIHRTLLEMPRHAHVPTDIHRCHHRHHVHKYQTYVCDSVRHSGCWRDLLGYAWTQQPPSRLQTRWDLRYVRYGPGQRASSQSDCRPQCSNSGRAAPLVRAIVAVEPGAFPAADAIHIKHGIMLVYPIYMCRKILSAQWQHPSMQACSPLAASKCFPTLMHHSLTPEALISPC